MEIQSQSRESSDQPPLVGENQERLVSNQQALIIGISHYQNGFQSLQNATRDAEAVADILKDAYDFTLLPGQTALLNEGATYSVMREVIVDSLQTASEGTRWLFYFAGHGTVVEEQGYLLPTNAVRGDLETYLSLRWLLDECQKSACGEILLILDACYSGRMLVRPQDLDDRLPERGNRHRIRQVITSGNPDQPVLDGGGSGHSIFTQSLLEALRGWAGIHELNGEIRFTRLLDHLVFEIPGRLRNLGLSAALQQPVGGNLHGSLRYDFIFQPIVPRLNPETVRGVRSADPGRRLENLSRLTGEIEQNPQLRPLAVELAVQHLKSEPGTNSPMLVTDTLGYEPSPEVRAQAAKTLGFLKAPVSLNPLLASLNDVPLVSRTAIRALGHLNQLGAAQPLLNKIQRVGDDLFLDLIDTIGVIGDDRVILEALREAFRRDKLIPFIGPEFPERLTGLPARATLARDLAQREGLPTSVSLASAASATMGKSQSRFTFTSFLKQSLENPLAHSGEIYQAFIHMKVPLWLSGAYDGSLSRALNANEIISGVDTQYWKPNRPTVIRVVGDVSRPASLVVTETDLEKLRENEGDRQLLVSYLRNALNDKVILFLGFDPDSPDFESLVKYVLNTHLTQLNVRAFLNWQDGRVKHRWGGFPIHLIGHEDVALVKALMNDAKNIPFA